MRAVINVTIEFYCQHRQCTFFISDRYSSNNQRPQDTIYNNTLSNHSSSKLFAFQTWDLTRLMYYGFTEFCQSFLQTFPVYYIWPLCLNGSALETIFSQLKSSMNGHLTSVNYAPALATLKLKRQIHGWRGKYVYRGTPLYVRELPLKRRSR